MLLYSGWVSRTKNRWRNISKNHLRTGEMLLFPISNLWEDSFLTRSYYENDFFVSSEPSRRNSYFNVVENVNHEKLDESWKTRWITKNSIFYLGIVLHSRKTRWITKNYVNHEKLAADFSRSKKSRRPSLHLFLQ